jgi:hypothetical protein
VLAFTFDTGSFLVGVATAVVTWAIIQLLGWLLGWPSRRKQTAVEEHERRAPIRAGARAVAAELREAAEIAERCEGGHHVPEETRKLRTAEWDNRKDEMLPIRDEDEGLWQEVENTYAALARSRRDGGHPPGSAELRALAERLAKVAG